MILRPQKRRQPYYKALMILATMASVVSCAKIENYIDDVFYSKSEILLGYQVINLKQGIYPELTIKYDYNGTILSDADKLAIDAIVSNDKKYIIEGTAGNNNTGAVTVANKRAVIVADYLITQGIRQEKIYIVNYDPSKNGRSSHIYTISE